MTVSFFFWPLYVKVSERSKEGCHIDCLIPVTDAKINSFLHRLKTIIKSTIWCFCSKPGEPQCCPSKFEEPWPLNLKICPWPHDQKIVEVIPKYHFRSFGVKVQSVHLFWAFHLISMGRFWALVTMVLWVSQKWISQQL